nr:hypothetical protein BOH68_15195 [Cobetia sp. MM1IDA2H-1]
MFADKDLEETRSQPGQVAQVRGPVRTFIKCRVMRSLLLVELLVKLLAKRLARSVTPAVGIGRE